MSEELAYTFVDKTGWGDGPWQSEPDKIQWIDATTGIYAEIAARRTRLAADDGPHQHVNHIRDWRYVIVDTLFGRDGIDRGTLVLASALCIAAIEAIDDHARQIAAQREAVTNGTA